MGKFFNTNIETSVINGLEYLHFNDYKVERSHFIKMTYDIYLSEKEDLEDMTDEGSSYKEWAEYSEEYIEELIMELGSK